MPLQENTPQYNLFSVLLTTAGRLEINQTSGIVRVVAFTNASGGLVLTGKVTAKVGLGDRVGCPLRFGQAVYYNHARRVIIEWEAQAGVTAEIFVSPDPALIDMDAEPPAQLVTGTLGGSFAASQDTVTTTAAAIVAANANRVACAIQNIGASDIWLGHSSAVAAGNGFRLQPGATWVVDDTTAAIYAVVASGTCDVSIWESGA